jgi:hypothetical protein
VSLTRRPWFWPLTAIVGYGLVGLLRAWPSPTVTPGGVPDAAYPLWSFWHFAYSDIVALYTTRGFYLHLWPYVQVPLEYPPVLGVFVWLASWVPHVGGFLVANAVALTAAAVGGLFIIGRVAGWRAARLWGFSPLLAIYMIYNWDVLGILPYGLAALAYRRGRHLWAGVFVGLGMATKLFPVVLLPFFLVDRWREGDRRGARQVLAGTAVAFVVPNAPFALLNFSGWATFWTFNTTRNASPGFWQWLVGHHLLGIGLVDGLSFLLVGAAALVLAGAVWRGRLSPLLAAALLLTFWLWMNKVYSPQYVIWVLFALAVADAVQKTAWMLAVTGILDFVLAMLWLATGYSHLPQVSLVGTYLAPVVILVRYATFFVILARWRRPALPESAAPA